MYTATYAIVFSLLAYTEPEGGNLLFKGAFSPLLIPNYQQSHKIGSPLFLQVCFYFSHSVIIRANDDIHQFTGRETRVSTFYSFRSFPRREAQF